MKKVKLLCCPFCGGKTSTVLDDRIFHDSKYLSYWVECDKCSSEGSKEDSIEKAIKAWNTRNTPVCKKT